MSTIYDNWERLVAAVLKRQEIWQLCHEHSSSPSFSSESSESIPSSRSSDELEYCYDQKQLVGRLVFLGSSNPRFRLKHTLKGVQELGKGGSGTTILTMLLRDVRVSDQELLEKGTQMVTKLLKEVRATASEEEFRQRMIVCGNCRHENVAAPKGYYFSNKANGKLIVYVYHNQGSVFDMLHGKKHLVSWESRLKVAIGAARGVVHIHKQQGGKMAHGNIKSSNIFLNSEQYGCISDFGLPSTMPARPAKMYLPNQDRTIRSRNLSQECDIYRFGILLLELLTGKTSKLSDQGLGSDIHVLAWVRSMKYNEFTDKLFDPSLEYDEDDRLEMVEMLCIATRCLEAHTICRPKMADVLLMLDSISRPYKIWSSWM